MRFGSFLRVKTQNIMDYKTEEAEFINAALASGKTMEDVNTFNDLYKCKSSKEELYQLALARKKKRSDI